MKVPFINFFREIQEIGPIIKEAMSRVIDSGHYILGPEVACFESEFARFCNASFCVGTATGTDALFLSLKAFGVGKGDEVITVANTFAATALAILHAGAKPAFVDIEKDSHLIDPAAVKDAITDKTKAIIPVHLYGMCADMDRISEIAKKHGLFVLEDACQAHGAFYKGKNVGSLGNMAAFSFYPTKNLGAYGDGGCVTTNDEGLYKEMLLLRNYGQTDRYHYEIPGYNSRLDELQAAVLRVKLQYLKEWIEKRQKIAARYDQGLKSINLISKKHAERSIHVYHLYVIAVEKRDELKKHLSDKGIETLVHYPVPLHKQKIFETARIDGALRNTETRASQIISLPFYPWLTDNEIDYVIDAVRGFYQ